MPLLCAIAIVRPEMKVIRGDSSVLLPGSSLQSARASKNYNLILFRTILHPPDSFVSKNEGMAEDGSPKFNVHPDWNHSISPRGQILEPSRLWPALGVSQQSLPELVRRGADVRFGHHR